MKGIRYAKRGHLGGHLGVRIRKERTAQRAPPKRGRNTRKKETLPLASGKFSSGRRDRAASKKRYIKNTNARQSGKRGRR